MEDKEIESLGLYHDGTQIVINLQNYRLPNRCLVSGEGLEAEHVPVIFYTWGIAEISYTFQVAGTVYSGSRISLGKQATYPNRQLATYLKRQYPLGNPVTVYHHARDPSRCTLRIASWGKVFQSIWPSLLAFAFATWGLTTGGILLLRAKG